MKYSRRRPRVLELIAQRGHAHELQITRISHVLWPYQTLFAIRLELILHQVDVFGELCDSFVGSKGEDIGFSRRVQVI